MNLDAMKELLAAVEAGKGLPATMTPNCARRGCWTYTLGMTAAQKYDVWKANAGDMNAALAVVEALMPDARWQAWSCLDGTGYGADVYTTSYAPNPARALLIATLRGKIAEMEGTTT